MSRTCACVCEHKHTTAALSHSNQPLFLVVVVCHDCGYKTTQIYARVRRVIVNKRALVRRCGADEQGAHFCIVVFRLVCA